MRIAFLGNAPWSVPPFEALVADPDTDVALALTNPPRPAGRGSHVRPTAVAEAARAAGVSLVEAAGVREGAGFEALAAAAPDALVVVAYGALLTPAVLDLAPRGAFNLHFSLLPRWRGASPVQHALLAGDPVTGVSVMRMDEGLDTGPVLARLEEPVREDDDAGSLGARLAHLGATLLVETLHRVADGAVVETPQDEGSATPAPKLGPGERTIDWGGSDAAIVRRVRAFAPAPGATTTFRGQPLKVLRATMLDVVPEVAASTSPPGTIEWNDGATGVPVATGGRSVHLLEVAPAGRRRMDAAAWARGARIRPGERLG